LPTFGHSGRSDASAGRRIDHPHGTFSGPGSSGACFCLTFGIPLQADAHRSTGSVHILVRDGQWSTPDDEWNRQASHRSTPDDERNRQASNRSTPDDEMYGQASNRSTRQRRTRGGDNQISGRDEEDTNETTKPGLLPLHFRLATFLFLGGTRLAWDFSRNKLRIAAALANKPNSVSAEGSGITTTCW